jgi:N-acylneuraminate cytidylyltransferase
LNKVIDAKSKFRNLIVIPARGGSKRLKGKNTKIFCGNSLINYTISFAKLVIGTGRIVVSTDDQEIANISNKMGIDVVFRPKHLASDTAKTSSSVRHALNHVENKTSILFDFVTTLQVTSPLRPRNILEKALNIISENPDINSIASVSPLKSKFGKIVDSYYQPINYSLEDRGQDIDSLYCENGNLYVTRSEFVREGDLFGKNIYPLIQEDDPTIDIDDLNDFKLGEYLFKSNFQKFGYLNEETNYD